MTNYGYGIQEYGTQQFGNFYPTGLITITSAMAIGTNEVKVFLNNPPKRNSSTGTGDALNPLTWDIQRLDTAEVLSVAFVNMYGPTIFGLVISGKFGDASVLHRVGSSTLLSETNELILPPKYVDFIGISTLEDSQFGLAKLRKTYPVDISNPHTPSLNIETTGGTLIINSSGDYETVTGEELIKKLIIRRLITNPGDFFHIPEYGIGLPVKETISTSDLVSLKSSIEKQIKREKEVSDCLAQIEMSADGVLNIKIKATLRDTGKQIEVGIQTQGF
jgi:hypothetical protein